MERERVKVARGREERRGKRGLERRMREKRMREERNQRGKWLEEGVAWSSVFWLDWWRKGEVRRKFRRRSRSEFAEGELLTVRK